MANPLKGESRLGDYTLAFNFGAFCALEEKTGHKMPQLLGALADGLGFGELRDFLWAALQAHHRGISDEDVLGLLDEHGYEATAAAIGKAVTAFFGAPKAKGKNPPTAG